MKRDQILIIALLLVSIILYYGLVLWVEVLFDEGKIQECFVNGSSYTNNYTSTVNMPINTRYSCQNICGPLARCSITGQQCQSDVDCFGCHKPLDKTIGKTNKVVRGQNDAGILTFNQPPRYSILTTDIGTRAKLYKDGINLKAPQYYEGVNKWRSSFDAGMELYDKMYNPSIEFQKFLPKYPKRPTLSGQFIIDGPLASNAYL